jgi:DNA-binding response OmpR family regulator
VVCDLLYGERRALRSGKLADCRELMKRILIIDDNRTLADVLCRYLTGIGFEISVATSGTRARELLESAPVDLVILDIGLPDCDGLDWLEAMRARQLSFPVVIVSSQSAAEVVKRVRESLAPAYLRKPFSLRYLRETVECALHG